MSFAASLRTTPRPSIAIYLTSLCFGALSVLVAQLGESSGVEILRTLGMAFLEIVMFLVDIKGPAAASMIALLLTAVYVMTGSEPIRGTIAKLSNGVVEAFTGIFGCFTGFGIGFVLAGYHEGIGILALSLLYSFFMLALYYAAYPDLSTLDRARLPVKPWVLALFFAVSGFFIGGSAYIV